jgi:putative intracellular protease/amidase
MLLYPGFTALDLVGPHYFFASLMGAKVDLVTTGQDLSPVRSDLGLAVSPTVTVSGATSAPTILFVPGGSAGTVAAMRDDAIADFVATRGAAATWVTSVCTGSLVLARAGLLKGRRATSHWVARDLLAEFGAIPVNERVVIDGNVVTGAGVTAGLDFAISLIAQLRGRPYAQALMLQGEYAPQPPFRGGTYESTDPAIAGAMKDMFATVTAEMAAIASSGR